MAGVISEKRHNFEQFIRKGIYIIVGNVDAIF
jgi:hypothetical protein